MMRKSLPAVLQQTLEQHVNKAQLTYDDELQSIYDGLKHLNHKVERLKNKIEKNRKKII
jgi:uncharacterized protein YukE